MMSYTKLTVSEPWDFKVTGGGNVLSGKVVRMIDDKNLVFEASENIEVQDAKGSLLILSVRYEGESFDGGKTKTVNGGVLLEDEYASSSAEELKSKSKFALIGSLS